MKKHIPFIIFFILYIGIGLSIYRDYGVSWDEGAQMALGRVNYNYITKGDPSLLTDPNRYHGPLFEVPLWRLTVKLSDPGMIYARHLCIFLMFALGSIALYMIAFGLFHNNWWSLLTVVFLVLSPRIFADSFYNSKDIPFLSFYTIAILSSILLLHSIWSTRKWKIKIGAAVLSAITCACAVDIRMPGIVLIPLTVGILILSSNRKRWKEVGLLLAIYLFLVIGFIILFWPTLWHDPIHEFINGYINMSHFPWKATVLLWGQAVKVDNLPWFYIPSWILISTPLLQLGGLILGIFSLVIIAGKKIILNHVGKFRLISDSINAENLAWLAIVGSLVAPLAAVIYLKSELYDGWRQMFFIYPSILLIAVFGLKAVAEKISTLLTHKVWFHLFAGLILLAGLSEPIIFSLKNHPFENVFFNVFAGDPATLRQKFDQDYWGLSYKQGVDYILAHDPSSEIHLAIATFPGSEYIQYMLAPAQAARLVEVPLENADYFITTFRRHLADYNFGKEYYSINVRGTVIMEVIKLK